MHIHLYTAFAHQGERGVYAALLHTETNNGPYRKKWYGTLQHTTPEHLQIHAVQEGLNAIQRQSSHTVTVHSDLDPQTYCPAHGPHQLTWEKAEAFKDTLTGLIPQRSGNRPRADVPYVPIDLPELGGVSLALSAHEDGFYLSQLTKKEVQPMTRLPDFFEGHEALRLTKDGHVIPRASYRELLLQRGETLSPLSLN